MNIKQQNVFLTNIRERIIIKKEIERNDYTLKVYKFLFICLFIFITYLTIKNSKISKNDIPSLSDTLNIHSEIVQNFDIISFFKYKSFILENISYTYSDNYKMVKLEYDIGLYDEKNNLIYPSDLTLYNNLHSSCYLEIYNETNNIYIYSLPNIYNNQFYRCTEFFIRNEKIKFGIIIYYKIEDRLFQFNNIYNLEEFNENNYSFINKNETMFDILSVNSEYNNSIIRETDNILNETLRFRDYYMKPPICDLKRNLIKNKIEWLFRNIYNNYFCFCVGANCLEKKIPQKIKYYIYMDIIEKNRDVYPKTDYIFVDFIFEGLSADDTYPIFEEMKKQNYPVHYITKKKDIINKYCEDEKYCPSIISFKSKNYYIYYGDFLEQYLTLILKTKSVISCRINSFHFVSYLFYRLEYITYIAVGHGVCYFKDYLFNSTRIYGNKRNNKILVPPSEILIEVPKRFGWRDEDIIKINLPRWDRYIYDNNNNSEGIEDNFEGIQISKNSILVMFTWRYIKSKLKKRISPYYNDNIIKILDNNLLNKALERKNVILYFSIHRYINKNYKKIYKNLIAKKKNIVFIEQNDISHCLAKTSLVVSDFSSIIFDLMYRRKPIIIFVPDSDEPDINNIYTNDYSQLIQAMNERKFNLENHFSTVQETVDKMIYYINNDFILDEKLKKFYETFGLKKGNSIDEFIEYLKNLP